jgi:hypothetical protein|tara:strand:- start:1601 stop:2005 length:405 start_codon:yes stop_codon:yes gene_type:complete
MENDLPFEETSVDHLETIFSTILKSSIQVELDEDNVEKKLFLHLINLLEPIVTKEDKVYDLGFDLSSITKKYILIIDILIKMHFGPETAVLIEWYLYNRIDRFGNIEPFTDHAGNEFNVETPEDLWKLIQKVGF